MVKKITFLFAFGLSMSPFAQVIPAERRTDWKIAGLRDTATQNFTSVDMQLHGIIGDGTTPNDAAVAAVISSLSGNGNILVFPAGNFLFDQPVTLTENVVIKGSGADATTFTFNLGGNGNSFNIEGTLGTDTTALIQAAPKDAFSVQLYDASAFSAGDWIQLFQQDADLVTSSWAIGSVGQIVRIISVSGNTLTLASPLRMDYVLERLPYARKINPVSNVGIECLKIRRTDNTAPQQSSNIRFTYAVNCWVNGIESENCTFAHIDATSAANLNIAKSYFHHAFEYGDGGRGYGIMLQAASSECRVEDNVFNHLRHSMIVQSGANGNVFAFNYSFDPYWPQSSPLVPANAAGDMVLHGNYVYLNLFEQNIGQNIVIDNSHGANGPYNTFFRNRAAGFGIFFSDNTSPYQNLVGNEIPNNTFPYNVANYNLAGTGHFVYGNNNKGTIDPAGTLVLADLSYGYSAKPEFTAPNQWAVIGTPNVMGSGYNQAYERNLAGNLFSNACGNSIAALPPVEIEGINVYPNPVTSEITVRSDLPFDKITWIDQLGQKRLVSDNSGTEMKIDLEKEAPGIYFLEIRFAGETKVLKIVKN